MHRFQLAALVALVISQPAIAASGVYKCVAPGGSTTYQSDPCDSSASETRLNIATAVADAPVRAAAPTATESAPASVEPSNVRTSVAAARRAPFPGGRRTLAVGMSDDEVLNLPGWGRPSSVTRARMPHAWHEEWVYRTPSAAEERHLHFVNMRLVSVDVEPAGTPLIQVAGQ
jgi:hypothetical protein